MNSRLDNLIRKYDIEIKNPIDLEPGPHDIMVLRGIEELCEKGIYDFVGAKVPCYENGNGSSSKRMLTDIDKIGIDKKDNRIDSFQYKSRFNERLLRRAIDQASLGTKYIDTFNGPNGNYPDIKDKLSELSSKDLDIYHGLRFGNFDYEKFKEKEEEGSVFDYMENLEVEKSAYIPDEEFKEIVKKIDNEEVDDLVCYLESQNFLN